MKRRLFVVLCIMILTVAVAMPAMAGSVALSVNGDPVKSAVMSLDNGVAMISVEDYARLAGVDVKYPGPDKLVLGEDGKNLTMTIGQTTALLGDKNVTLPRNPVKSGDTVMIPLRFVAGAFGYDVQWDDKQWQVSLTRTETRDGMTPEELLAKSTQACQKFNTYAMEGTMEFDMNLASGGPDKENMPMKLTSQIYSQYQNEPFGVYMKQTIKPGNNELMPGDMVMETYMTPEKMYMKLPQQEWMVQDMPFPAEFWKQQQDIQSDPIKAVAQMKEFGLLVNFGNDTTVNGQDYYVINATMDMEKLMQGYQKIMNQVVQSLPAEEKETGSAEEMQAFMQKMLEKMVLDCYYTTYINKETLISDLVKFNINMELAMELPAGAKTAGENENPAMQNINMSMKSRGEFLIKDCGMPFTAPDVSKAKASAETGK